MATLPQRKDYEMRFTSKEDFKSFLMENSNLLGIDGWKNGKFSIRNETTPSCIINKGWFYDCGSGKSGNIIDLIINANSFGSDIESFKKACRLAEDMLNMPRTGNYSGIANSQEKDRVYLPKMEENILEKYRENKKQNIALFEYIVKGLCRNLTKDLTDYVVKKLDISLYIEEVTTKNNFTFIDKRVFIPTYNKNNEVFNFVAYNRKSKLKAIKRKEGKPSLFGENFIPLYKKDVLWVEGDSDYVHSQALDIHSITAGSASIRINSFLPQLKGKNIHFIVDNDKAGAQAIARWFLEIKEFNKNVNNIDKIGMNFLWWSSLSVEKAKSIIFEEIKSKLTRNLDPELQKKLFSFSKEIKLTPIINDIYPRKKGYDFTDFIKDYGIEETKRVFSNFISK